MTKEVKSSGIAALLNLIPFVHQRRHLLAWYNSQDKRYLEGLRSIYLNCGILRTGFTVSLWRQY